MQAARGASLTPGDPTPPRGVRLLLFGCALGAFLLDAATKTAAVALLDPAKPVEVIGPWLRLTLVRNPGAAFSTGTSLTLLLSLVAVGAVVTILVLSRRVASRGWAVALGLLLGGVVGNLADRLLRDPGVLRGHVVDFLQLPSWPVFNVADICINTAAALIVWHSLRGRTLSGSLVQEESDGPAERTAEQT